MVRERSPSRTSSGQHLSPQKSERRPLANIGVKMQSPSPKQTEGDGDEASRKAPLQPEFGKASPLHNPLKKTAPNIFMPKKKPVQRPSPSNPLYSTQTAPNHSTSAGPAPPAVPKAFYLPGKRPPSVPGPSYSSALEAAEAFASQSFESTFEPAPVEIRKPTNPPLLGRAPRPPPTFSSLGPNTYYQPYVPPKAPIDLTRSEDDGEDDTSFDPDASILEQSQAFGEPDPYRYVDSEQANENIKNLLEGAFDDDDEKSRTRLRQRAKRTLNESNEKKAKSLANRLQALEVKDEDDELAASADKGATEDPEEDDGTVEGLKVKLLPHQVEGVAWMIDKEIGAGNKTKQPPKGGILADDMGLGKTIQSMTLILTNPRPAPDAKPEHKLHKLPPLEVGKGTLVVAPLALIKQWEDEIKTKIVKSHALRVLVHHGPSRTKSAIELKKYDVVITTYQTLTSEHAGSNMAFSDGPRIGCFGVSWYRIILDEAHSIKNRNAKSTQAACALEAWYRWCLTGTPMQNSLDELQSLIKFLRIEPYSVLQNWKASIIQPMKNGRGGLAMKRLQIFLKVIMKRRTKDVLKKEGALNFGGKVSDENEETCDETKPARPNAGGMKIVKREVVIVECDFNDEEKDFYTRLQSRADKRIAQIKQQKKADYIGALVLLLRLRQACNHPQLIEMAMNKDKDAMSTGMSGNAGDPLKQFGFDGGEMDALTALMGGISVTPTHCDVCQIELSKAEVGECRIRCKECEQDLAKMKHRNKIALPDMGRTAKQRVRNRRVVSDSDEDDEGEGAWIAEGPERLIDLGKAGGSEDEDAEGGGETLGSIDSDRSADDDEDEEDSPPRAHMRRRRVAVQAESDSETTDDEGASKDGSDVDFDSEASILKGFQLNGESSGKPSTKIRRLLRILHTELPKHKTIVFSQFTSMLDLIEPHLRASNFRFARYDGSMRPDAREASLHSLRHDSKCRILLCSLKCGSLGLNLTAASRVVIVEPFWNPFVEEQAIDRVHRLNQTVDVKVYRLTVRDTVEAEILNLQNRKRELAEAAVEGSNKAGVGKLSMQDILSLFGHDAEHSVQHDKENQEMWKKFGSDHRLLDGQGAGYEQTGRIIQRDGRVGKSGKEKLSKEHSVYGRRW